MTTSTVRKIHINSGSMTIELPIEIASWSALQTLLNNSSIDGSSVSTVKMDVGFKQEPHRELLFFSYGGAWCAANIEGFQTVEEFFLKQVGINKYGW
jgi:hypothetical protein